jgi:hypothetical protein
VEFKQLVGCHSSSQFDENDKKVVHSIPLAIASIALLFYLDCYRSKHRLMLYRLVARTYFRFADAVVRSKCQDRVLQSLQRRRPIRPRQTGFEMPQRSLASRAFNDLASLAPLRLFIVG